MHDWQYVLWILGTLAKIDDYEAKAFFYDMSDRIDGFLRYLINRPDKVLFHEKRECSRTCIPQGHPNS